MVFNEINDKGQLTQLLQRRLNMNGPSPAPSLMPEIGPTLCLENDRFEYGALKGENNYARGFGIGASGAGNHGLVVAENPLNSGALFTIQQLQINTDSRCYVVRTALIPAYTLITPLRGQVLDGRIPLASIATLNTGHTPTANILPQTFLHNVGIREFEAVIPPGWSFVLVAETPNLACQYSLAWRERGAMSGELG